jgi:hypothetical protein
MMKIPSAKLPLCLVLLLSIAGCYHVRLGSDAPEDAVVGPNDYALMVGESMTLNMTGVSTGMETQGWDCDDEEDDKMIVSDPSVMSVEKQAYTKRVYVGRDINAPVFKLTALKPGDVTITATCVDEEATVHVKVLKRPAPHLAPKTDDSYRATTTK